MERFSNTKKLTQANLKNVPSTEPGLYRIKDVNGRLLYVGMAMNGHLPERIYEHRGELKGGTQFQYRIVKNKEIAKKLEILEIKKLAPLRNIL